MESRHMDDPIDVLDDESDASITQLCMLIDLVKSNPVLYQKKLKGYSKTDKPFIWANIGELLIPPMTGKYCK